MTKPWEDTLTFDVGESDMYSALHKTAVLDMCNIWDGAAFREDEYARMLAAAPAMARALCLVEWSGRYNSGYGTMRELDGECCPVCELHHRKAHKPGCHLDAALTAAGLTPEDREAVRQRFTK